jgi:hypothetical protein
MRILIMSDTHGDLAAWRKVLERFGEGIDYILHAGDVLYHPFGLPIPSTYDAIGLAAAMNDSPCPMVIARGNCDADVFSVVLRWPLQDPIAFLHLGDLRILVTHGHRITRSEFADLARWYGAQLVVFGHIHKPVLDIEGNALILNPGSVSLSQYAPEGKAVQTAALLSDRLVEVFDVDTGEIVARGSVQ